MSCGLATPRLRGCIQTINRGPSKSKNPIRGRDSRKGLSPVLHDSSPKREQRSSPKRIGGLSARNHHGLHGNCLHRGVGNDLHRHGGRSGRDLRHMKVHRVLLPRHRFADRPDDPPDRTRVNLPQDQRLRWARRHRLNRALRARRHRLNDRRLRRRRHRLNRALRARIRNDQRRRGQNRHRDQRSGRGLVIGPRRIYPYRDERKA